MKKTFLIVAALVSFTAFAFAGDALEITIDVAPNVLNLQRTDDKCVTVHTNIPYDEVDCTSVTLEAEGGSITPYLCKNDDSGNFVAKFSMAVVRELPLTPDEYNTFTLSGFKDDGEAFSGTQEIWVVDNDDPINGPNNGPKGPR